MPLAKWSEYKWPKWVPQKVRSEIESFWSNEWGRDYHQWLAGCYAPYNYQPHIGAKVHINRPPWQCKGRKVRVGKWIPAWNNMARIVLSDGSIQVVSTCDIVDGERELWKARQLRTTNASQNV